MGQSRLAAPRPTGWVLPTAILTKAACRFLRFVQLDIRDKNSQAIARESLGNGCANPNGGSGDERNLRVSFCRHCYLAPLSYAGQEKPTVKRR
jgi:hypothetical protein